MRELIAIAAVLVVMGAGLEGLAGLVRADDVPACKPSCPSAKTIAEQVVEDIDAKPRPTVVKCQKGHVTRTGFVARCLVLFPTAGTPPLQRGGPED